MIRDFSWYRGVEKTRFIRLVVGAISFVGLGVYTVLLTSVNDSRIFFIGLVIPVFIGLVFTRYAPRILLGMLVLSLTLSARFRLTGIDFHTGGAEAAVAPIDFAILGLLFWMALKSFRDRTVFALPLTPLTLTFPLLIMAHLPSVWIAEEARLAFLEILRLLKMGVLVLVLSYYVKTEKDLLFVVKMLFISISIQGTLAILQAQVGFTAGLGFLGERDTVWVLERGEFAASRAGGTLGHANALAHFLEMMLPMALAAAISRLPTRLRGLSFAALCLGILGLYLTLSRGGWGATLIGFAVVLMGNRQWRIRGQRRRMFAYMLLILLFLAFLGLLLWPTIEQRITQFSAASWLFRLRTYDVALQMTRDHPWLGVGANNYLEIATQYSAEVLRAWPEAIVHNVYLLVLAETGIVGLFAFLIFLSAVLRQAVHLARDRDLLKATIALGVLGGLCALLVHSLLGWLFRYDPVYTLFWFHVGLLVVLWRMPGDAQAPARSAKPSRVSSQ